MLHIIANIFILIAIIFAMSVILLGLRHLGHDDLPDTHESTGRLRRDVKNDETVISHDSVFHNFLVGGNTRRRNASPSTVSVKKH